MNCKKFTYNKMQRFSCFFMILALLWLTASAPFVVEIKSKINKQYGVAYSDLQEQAAGENSNPYSGLNEEQCNGSGSYSEYLHEAISFTPFSAQQITHNSFIDGEIYIAYYGELLSPPPEYMIG